MIEWNVSKRIVCLIVLLILASATYVVAQESFRCGSILNQEDIFYIKENNKSLLYNKAVDFSRKREMLIPVQFHIVRKDDGSGGFDSEDIANQLEKMNVAFVETGNQFIECNVPNEINSSRFFDLDYLQEAYAMEAIYNVPKVINIYIVNSLLLVNNDVEGIAEFPWSLHDLIVFNGNDLSKDPLLVHELGHYFGLLHTHEQNSTGAELVDGSNCMEAGDLVCDTEADPLLGVFNVNVQCEYYGTTVDLNGVPYTPPVDNIMSFSPNNCKDQFTAGQFERLENYRLEYHADLVCPDEQDSVSLVINIDGTDGGTVAGAGKYLEGEAAVIKAKSNEDWTFVAWKEKELILSTDTIMALPMYANRTITAEFQLDSLLSSSGVLQELKGISIYPNPVKNKLTIDFSDRTLNDFVLEIYDVKGQRMIRRTFEHNLQNKITIDMMAWSDGVYFVNIHAKKGGKTFSFVK